MDWEKVRVFAKASKVCYVRDSYFIPMKTPCHKN